MRERRSHPGRSKRTYGDRKRHECERGDEPGQRASVLDETALDPFHGPEIRVERDQCDQRDERPDSE